MRKCGHIYDYMFIQEGYINLGTAVNSLCEDILSERLNQVHTVTKIALVQYSVWPSGPTVCGE